MPADEAIILVGGMGTRLRPVVSDVPKPLAPVAGRPFLAWLLDALSESQLRRVILATGYKAPLVESTIGASWKGLEIIYVIEDEPLGTGGAVRNAVSRLLGDGVHVVNGDTFLRYSLDGLERATYAAGVGLGLALAEVADVGRYGAVEIDDGKVVAFCEKGGAGHGWINAGSYYLGTSALSRLPESRKFSFEADFLVPQAQQSQVAAFTETGGFIDIGIPEDFARAQTLFRAV